MAADLSKLRADATAAQQAGDLDTAAARYAAYLARKPDDAGIWSNLGVLHRAKGRHHMALRAQRRAIALQPHAVGISFPISVTMMNRWRCVAGYWRTIHKT